MSPVVPPISVIITSALLAAAASHPDVLTEPEPEVEFVEAGVTALRFQLQVWSTAHLKSAGKLKSDLNFEIWRNLAAEGVTIPPGILAFGVAIQTPEKH